MPLLNRLAQWWYERLDETRLHLSRPEALLVMSLFGLATGVAAGAVIIVFRLLVEGTQEVLLPGEGPENYEALGGWARFFLPILGGLLLAIMFRWFADGMYVLGVARVMERMAYHQGHLTLRGFLLQFAGAAIAIINGHSVGREGPHVFLGAATGSLLGQQFSLPNNAIRTLVGCGTAAGIGASFNTPLAGVAFALEVVMMEYSVANFIPIILAAVSATTLSNAVLGTHTAFSTPPAAIDGFAELGLVVVLGVIVGTVSAGFNQALESVAAATRRIAIWWRMLLAGVAMGAFGLLIPQVMGIGYDSVQQALHGEIALGLLALLLIGKLAATSVALGLGVPGGVIGPSLFVGAMAGALLVELVSLLPIAGELPVGMFALLGMGAAMSASLQAPLAGLTAMLELTDNPAIILPGMLAVVVSGITARELFRKESLFVTMLKAGGLDYRANPVLQALRRRGVASVMERRFERVPSELSLELCYAALEREPDWLLVDADGQPELLMPAVELAKYLETGHLIPEDGTVDLRTIPAERYKIAAVHLQATLQEALERFDRGEAEALYVERMTAPGIRRIYGVLTRPMVERTYRV